MKYADVINGKFDMTWEDVVNQVKSFPFTTSPDDIFFYDDNGIGYTLRDISEMEGIELEILE